MNQKEEEILREIINYVKENQIMPTRRFLQKKFKFKSVNSITRYIKSLEKNNYLIRNNEGKLILNNASLFYQDNLKTIKIINLANQRVQLFLDKRKNYLAYRISNNNFCDKGISRGDILIVEINKKPQNNDLGLFIINNKYRIMRYKYKDGFYCLKDKEELVLNKVKLIGKVIIVEKKLWDKSQSF